MINNKRSYEVVSFEGMIHFLQKRCQSVFYGPGVTCCRPGGLFGVISLSV